MAEQGDAQDIKVRTGCSCACDTAHQAHAAQARLVQPLQDDNAQVCLFCAAFKTHGRPPGEHATVYKRKEAQLSSIAR
jgi:hypothetical protein